MAIEDVAQGGWCVARPEGLPVMFVRHALPGERVIARVTEVTSKFARADAVDDPPRPSPDRVDAPCPHARPGGCGGCDWQHASLPAQRALKATVITQQLRRLPASTARSRSSRCPATTGGGRGNGAPARHTAAAGLGWRTRVQFAVDRDGIAGLRGHRSHRVVDIGDCLIAHQAVRDLDIPGDDWSGATMVEVAVGGAQSAENFAVTVIEGGGQGQRDKPKAGARAAGTAAAVAAGPPGQGGPWWRAGRTWPSRPAGRLWQVSADGFWQVHPGSRGHAQRGRGRGP